MAISKLILNGVTQMDVTGVTAQQSDVMSPETFVACDGIEYQGTGTGTSSVYYQDSVDACGGTVRNIIVDDEFQLVTLTATANNTYTAPSGYAYDEVVVNVSGGIDPNDFAAGLVPSGDITLTGNAPISTYGISGRKNITSIYIPTATVITSSGNYCIVQNSGSFTVYAPYVTGLPAYGIANNTGLTAVCLPSITGGLGSNNLRANANMTVADVGSVTGFSNTTFYGCTKLTSVILRKTDAITTLANITVFQNTPFYTGGTGGTVYIPKALYDHLGDNSALDYQAASNWSTLYNGGTLAFAKLEGSAYESTSWIVD